MCTFVLKYLFISGGMVKKENMKERYFYFLLLTLLPFGVKAQMAADIASAPESDWRTKWEKTFGVRMPKIQGKYGPMMGNLIAVYPKTGGLYLVDRTGAKVSQTYTRIHPLQNGYMVAEGDVVAVLDAKGREVLQRPRDCKGHSPVVSEGVWAVQEVGGKWYYVDLQGKACAGRYAQCAPFQQNMGLVHNEAGKIGFVQDWSQPAECLYDYCHTPYAQHYAWVQQGGKSFCLLHIPTKKLVREFSCENAAADIDALEHRLDAITDRMERDQVRLIRQQGYDVKVRVAQTKSILHVMHAAQQDILQKKREELKSGYVTHAPRPMVEVGNISEHAGLAVAALEEDAWGFVTLEGQMLNSTFVFTTREDANRALNRLEEATLPVTRDAIERVIRTSLPSVNQGSLYDVQTDKLWDY